MEQGFGVMHFIAQADTLAKSIMVLLLAMSAVSWYLILIKALLNLSDARLGSRFLALFSGANSIPELTALLHQRQLDNPIARLVHDGLSMAEHCRRQGATHFSDAGAGDMVSRALRQAMQREMARRERGLTFLAATASSAPFIGLFGTVWGIYQALINIGMSGQGTLDKVAGPVGEALIMTAAGLAVAIPAVLAYNFLVRANRRLSGELNQCAHELFTLLATGQRQPVEVSAPSQAALNANPAKAHA